MSKEPAQPFPLALFYEAAEALAGTSMLPWLQENVEKSVSLTGQESQETLRLVRFYADAIASAQRYCDPVLHRKTLLLNNDLTRLDRESDLATSMNPMAYAFDALELARCVAIVAERYEGIRQNTFRSALEDYARSNARLTPAKKAALELFTQACGVFCEMGRQAASVSIDPHRQASLETLLTVLKDQEAFSGQAVHLVKNMKIPTTPSATIMRRSAAGTSGGLLDYFRRFLLEEAPLEVVLKAIAEPKPKVVEPRPIFPSPQDDPPPPSALGRTLGTTIRQEGAYTFIDNPYNGLNQKQRDQIIARFTDVPHLLAKYLGVSLNGGTIDPKSSESIDRVISICRQKLDDLEQSAGVVHQQLLRRLAPLLLARRQVPSSKLSEEGDLNPLAYPHLISDPMAMDVYQSSHFRDYSNATITLLRDDSISTKGAVNEAITICVDQVARALELGGSKIEIIGFTSARMAKEMKSQDFLGLPQPLKDELTATQNILWQECAQLILYKDYGAPWRRARQELAAALTESHFSGTPEGIAVYYAWRRIRQRPEQKKVIIVIGDGEANDPLLLGNTLADIKREGRVHVLSIKIGNAHDNDVGYPHSIAINEPAELLPALNRELIKALSSPLPRPQRGKKTSFSGQNL
jgi:hypothetical protein